MSACGEGAVCLRIDMGVWSRLWLAGIAILASVLAVRSAGGAEPPRPWAPELLRDPSLWKEGARNLASVGADGVRIEVGPGHTWELVAQSRLQLLENVGRVRVRIPGSREKFLDRRACPR